MHYYHRHSFFPLVTIVLSVLLAGLIYWSVKSEPSSNASLPVQEVEPVDANAYRDELTQIMRTFYTRMVSSQDDLDKLLAVQTALASLLTLRVPVEFKELHLALAVALSDMENDLQSENRNIDEPLSKIDELKQMHSWIAP